MGIEAPLLARRWCGSEDGPARRAANVLNRETVDEERRAKSDRSTDSFEHDQKTGDRSNRGSDPAIDRPKQKQKKQPRNVDTTIPWKQTDRTER